MIVYMYLATAAYVDPQPERIPIGARLQRDYTYSASFYSTTLANKSPCGEKVPTGIPCTIKAGTSSDYFHAAGVIAASCSRYNIAYVVPV